MNSNSLKVALVASPHIPVPPPKYGGTELVIYHLIKGLKELGHEPILLAPGDSDVDCELIPTVDTAVPFPMTKAEAPKYERQIESINKKIERKLRRLLKKVDIIHSHGFDLYKFQNFPNLTTVHGMFTFRDLDFYLTRKNLHYVSISKNQQEALPALNYAGVVYNGENPDDFPFVEKPDDYVCFMGRFDREKNPHLAIQLAINLGLKVKVAGKVDFQGREYFEEEMKPLLDHPLVEYLGELGFKEKVELVAHAKCNLHPTAFREPFGLTVLEAAYCGTPTLATMRGSMSELIEEGRTGMLVEDFVEGYHQIEACFQMDRSYISNRARKTFNYKNMAEGYMQAYQHVIDKFHPRRIHDRAIQLLSTESRRKLADTWASSWHQLW
jgi:glycosyltransferase involved in cell wall biosynthesis